jgi:tetratricopeptide (TPR) repeat protein
MKILFTFLLFVITTYSYAQEKDKDSIQQLLNSKIDQNKKAILYSDLANIIKKTDIDSAKYYARLGLKLSELLSYRVGIAESSVSLGGCYVIQNDLDSAKVYYARARDLFGKTDSLFKYAQNTMRLGNIYLAQNDHIESLKLYQESSTISQENNFTSLIPHLYNNIGLVYKQIEEYDDAKNNFQKAYTLFLENNDESNSVYPLYNIALIESTIGNDEKAIDGYLNLTSFHLKTENWVTLASVYNSISEIYLKNGDFERAKEYLQMALNAMEDKSDSFNTGPSSFYVASIYTNAAELYFKNGENNLAKKYAQWAIKLSKENSYKINVFKSAKILAEIYDKEKQIDSSLQYHKIYIDYNNQYRDEYDVKQLTKLKMQNEFDEILKQNEIERIYQEVEYKNRELKFIGVTGFAVLLAVILVLLYFIQRNRNAKLKLKEENLVLEKKKLNQDLEYKKKELVSNMMYLMEKNEFITTISKKLIELKPDAKKDNKDLIQQIINEIRLNSSTQMWEEFEMRFKEVHKDFYNGLHNAHPDLTLNEVKICAFLRLNMSTKEISAITHQSVKSINMARFRLRKKLDIDRDENLIAYLNSLN